MKKILFSTTSFDTINNGPALFVNLLYENLKNDDEVDLRVLTEDTSRSSGKIYKLGLKQTTFTKYIYQFLRVFKYHQKANKIRKEFNYDVIVYNNAFTGYLTALYAKVPVIVMVNDYNRLQRKTQKIKLNKSYFKNVILFYLEKIAAKKATTVIANSLYMKSMLLQLYQLDENKIEILIKGIDLSKYRFKLRENIDGVIKVLFVKADYRTGQLINVIKALKSLTNFKFQLIVIGPPQHEINNVKMILEESLLNYELYGFLKPEVVRTYFQKADILCMCPLREALGVANMEALASGLPVISSNVGGIPEVLDRGNCGWMVAPDKTNELQDALLECIVNKEKRIEKSLNGKEFVKKFDSKNLIKNFLNIVSVSNY